MGEDGASEKTSVTRVGSFFEAATSASRRFVFFVPAATRGRLVHSSQYFARGPPGLKIVGQEAHFFSA